MEPPRWEPSYHASEAKALQDTKPRSSSSELVRSFIEKTGRSIGSKLPLLGSKSGRAKPGALERLEVPDPTLTTVIDRYTDESIKKIGRTKAQDVERARNKTITVKAGEFEVSPFKDRRPATYLIS